MVVRVWRRFRRRKRVVDRPCVFVYVRVCVRVFRVLRRTDLCLQATLVFQHIRLVFQRIASLAWGRVAIHRSLLRAASFWLALCMYFSRSCALSPAPCLGERHSA